MKILIIIWIHFIADFVLQPDKIALNKSKSNKWLLFHSLVYCLPLTLLGFEYAIINGIFHFCVDYITSRGTSKLWISNQRHLFFTLIGLDQAIHMTCLIVTFSLMV
jgi:hypothetical protein